MADLRRRFAALDAAPMPDLWPDIERRALAGAPSGGAHPVAPAGPTWRGTEPGAAGARRLVLVLVLIGLLVITLLGAALVGAGLMHDPLRGFVRPAEADERATASSEPAASAHLDVLPDGVTALPTCPDGEVEPIQRGTLPELGTLITGAANGLIAVAADTGVDALDAAADPPTGFGMAPPLARFLYDPLVSSMAWSPDGRWLAFVATGGVVFGSSPRRVFCQDLFVVPATGGVATNMTEHRAWTRLVDIAWSPDGRWLAYASNDAADLAGIFDPPRPSPAPDPAHNAIVAIRLADDLTVADRRQVWSGRVSAGLTWSRRGELAFAAGDDGDLLLIGPGADAAREATALRGVSQASWAPDGDRLLLVDGEGLLVTLDVHGDRAPLTRELWVPGAPRTNGDQVSSQYVGEAARWMPDGRSIVMTTTAESSAGRESAVVKVMADGDDASIETLLAVDQVVPYPMAGPVVSPDGALLAYSLDGVGGGDDGVWVMRADGTGQRRISAPLSLGIAGPAAWQPLP